MKLSKPRKILSRGRTVASIALGLAMSLHFAGFNSAHADQYSAFTEPKSTIELAASDTTTVRTIHVKLGENVKRGQLIVTLDISVLEAARRVALSKANAKATVRSLEIEHEVKQERYERLLEISEDGAVGIEELARAKADKEIAFQKIQEAKENRDQALLEVNRIDAEINRRKISSPVAGIVTSLNKESGEAVSLTESNIATICELNELRLVFFISTLDAKKLNSRKSVAISIKGESRKLIGEVEYLSPITMADSGRVQLNVLIDNSGHGIRSGIIGRLIIE